MKIGLVIYGSLDTLSGGYLYDRKLVEYLRAQGDSVEIISLPWRNYAAHLTDNFHFRLPASNVIASRAAAKQSPNGRKFDILIQDELNHPSLILANRGKHPYPVVSLVHHLRSSEPRPTWQNALYGAIEKRYLQSVDGFIFNSQTTRRSVQALAGTDAEKPYIIAYPAGNRLGRIAKEEIIARTAQISPLRILFIGSVIPRKCLHTLLDAIARLPPLSVTLDVAGGLTSDPEYVKRIYRQVSRNGLERIVKFHGALTDQTFVDLLRSSHIMVLPSSYEGFGIAYLEAMAFGLPSIGTTSGAAWEVVEDGETGFLIPPENSVLLAERVELFVNSKEKLLQMSLTAREKFSEYPMWEESFAKVRQFLLDSSRKI